MEVWKEGVELGLLFGAVEGGVRSQQIVERLIRVLRGEGVAARRRVDDGVDQLGVVLQGAS